MIILDTNVLSELAKPRPDERVLSWVDSEPDLALTATTLGEILLGLRRLPQGRRRALLEAAMAAIVDEELSGRVVPYGREACEAYAGIVALRLESGKPIGLSDAQIAAVAKAAAATVATRNVKDFLGTGVRILNPWTGQIHEPDDVSCEQRPPHQ